MSFCCLSDELFLISFVLLCLLESAEVPWCRCRVANFKTVTHALAQRCVVARKAHFAERKSFFAIFSLGRARWLARNRFVCRARQMLSASFRFDRQDRSNMADTKMNILGRSLFLFAVMMLGCGGGPGVTGAAAAKTAHQTVSPAILSSPIIYSTGTATDGVACDVAADNVGWCDTSTAVIFCDDGKWRTIACATVLEGSLCSVRADKVVDCVKK